MDVVWFIDNKAVFSAAVKGTADSSATDMEEILIYSHLLFAKYNIRVWFEWVDSDSNPSDGLSRDGLDDEWTKKQSWECREASPPAWEKIRSDIDELLHSSIA